MEAVCQQASLFQGWIHCRRYELIKQEKNHTTSAVLEQPWVEVKLDRYPCAGGHQRRLQQWP